MRVFVASFMLLREQNSRVLLYRSATPVDLSSYYPELHVLRDILMHKYGREFSVGVMENRNNCVSDRVRKSPLSVPVDSLNMTGF